ncbi:STE3-like pheromone receptor [Serendipita vermifera]|nr:STE3-like pheromone receptor [Serendipita vermifera]
MRELPFVMGCAVAMILLLLPAAWHIRSRNSGTIIYIGWSLVGNLIYFVNSIVWAGNLRNPAPVWCDISTKIIVGLTVGLPCASLCIQRRLYLVSRVSSTSSTPEQRRREVMIDIGIGLGVPCLVMTLHYVVQGHRFNILEDYGCWPATYITGLTIPLVFMWPILISLISIPYCIGSYIQFHRRRAEFQKFLASNEPGLNVDRYLRLMALASMEIIIVLPLNLLSIIGNLTNKPLQPWVSWAYVHYNFSRVSYVPRWLLDANKKQAVQFTISRWAIPCSGILFFLFFGLSVEARKDYYRVANLVLGVFGVKLTPPSSPRASRSL